MFIQAREDTGGQAAQVQFVSVALRAILQITAQPTPLAQYIATQFAQYPQLMSMDTCMHSAFEYYSLLHERISHSLLVVLCHFMYLTFLRLALPFIS